MAWQEKETLVPTTIGTMRSELRDKDGTVPEMGMITNVHIMDQNGDEMDSWNGDPVPHLSPATIQLGIDFLTAVRAEAVAAFIPTP